VFANVPVPVTLPVPSNTPEVYAKSPVIATVLPVAS